MARRLFVIGNGFDLAHGLPTTYDDFHKFLKQEYPDADENNEMIPGWSTGNHGDVQFCEKDVIGYLMNLLSRSSNENWSDFEDALGHLDFGNAFFSLEEELDREGDPNPWHTVYNNEDLASDLSCCLPRLSELFSDWVNTIRLDRTRGMPCFASLIDRNRDLFLNFNYTKTLEKIYGAQNVCHIHGVQGGNILVGHGEGNLFDEKHPCPYIGCEDGLEQIHAFFRKDTKGALHTHQPFFDLLAANISAIYSYGFSFSKVDRIYIREICNRIDTKSTTWYLHKHKPGSHGEYQSIIRDCGFRGSFSTFDT